MTRRDPTPSWWSTFSHCASRPSSWRGCVPPRRHAHHSDGGASRYGASSQWCALLTPPVPLLQVDREQLAREFFATRGALLESGDLRDPAAAEGASRAMQERMRVDATRGVPSLLAALTGMRHNADLRARGRRLCVPTALLQTHHNSLIMPSTARALSRALTGGSAAEKAAEAERERRRRSGVGPPGPPPIEVRWSRCRGVGH